MNTDQKTGLSQSWHPSGRDRQQCILEGNIKENKAARKQRAGLGCNAEVSQGAWPRRSEQSPGGEERVATLCFVEGRSRQWKQ